MIRAPRYGELQTRNLHPEIYKIWLTRNDELPDMDLDVIPSVEFQSICVEDEVFANEIVQMTKDSLPDRYLHVIAMRICGASLEDVAVDMDVTRERVRQMEKKAIRKMKLVAYRRKVFG